MTLPGWTKRFGWWIGWCAKPTEKKKARMLRRPWPLEVRITIEPLSCGLPDRGESQFPAFLIPLFRALNVRLHLLLKNLERQRAVPEHDVMEFALVELWSQLHLRACP